MTPLHLLSREFPLYQLQTALNTCIPTVSHEELLLRKVIAELIICRFSFYFIFINAIIVSSEWWDRCHYDIRALWFFPALFYTLINWKHLFSHAANFLHLFSHTAQWLNRNAWFSVIQKGKKPVPCGKQAFNCVRIKPMRQLKDGVLRSHSLFPCQTLQR